MRRREFIAALGGVAALPFVARAQQAMPVIGFFNSGRALNQVKNVAAFREGLKEVGFVEGRNVAIEFRWADNQFDKLPAKTGVYYFHDVKGKIIYLHDYWG